MAESGQGDGGVAGHATERGADVRGVRARPVEPSRAEMSAAEDRSAFRAWVRAHHPDLGGDPVEFAAGLRGRRATHDRRARNGPPAPRPEVIVVRRRRWPLALLERRRGRRLRARLLV